MLITEMLARLRTAIDEASAGFWSDAECYSALTDGQLEAFKILYSTNPKDKRLQVLMKDASATITDNYISIPVDMWENFIVTAEWAKISGDDVVYCDILSYDKDLQYLKSNSYKSPVSSRPIAYIKSSTALGNRIYFEPSGTSSDYVITYLTVPTAISASVEPQITPSLHPAIIVYALSFILRKAKLNERADAEFKNFIGMVKNAG